MNEKPYFHLKAAAVFVTIPVLDLGPRYRRNSSLNNLKLKEILFFYCFYSLVKHIQANKILLLMAIADFQFFHDVIFA